MNQHLLACFDKSVSFLIIFMLERNLWRSKNLLGNAALILRFVYFGNVVGSWTLLEWKGTRLPLD